MLRWVRAPLGGVPRFSGHLPFAVKAARKGSSDACSVSGGVRRRAVELATKDDAKIAEVARDLGIAESGLRRWIAKNAVDGGRAEGLTMTEKRELVELRRRTRVLEMENMPV